MSNEKRNDSSIRRRRKKRVPIPAPMIEKRLMNFKKTIKEIEERIEAL